MAKSKIGMSVNEPAVVEVGNKGGRSRSADDRQAAPVAKATRPATRATRPATPPTTTRVVRQPLSAGDAGQDDSAPIAPGGDVGLEEREEMIRNAAYERYVQRGGQGGSAIDDWLQAEAAIDSPGRQTDQQRDKP